MHTAFRAEITPEQLQTLVDRACQRIDQLKGEIEGSQWYAKREKYERRAAEDFSDRLAPKTPEAETTVFDKSNVSLNTPRAINRFLEARLYKDLFSAKPFYSVKPQGQADNALADQIQPHSAYKLREANWDEQAKQILKYILDLGECPFIVTHKTTVDISTKVAMVLVDVQTNQPVQGEDGSYIEEDSPSEAVELYQDDGTEEGTPIIDPETGEIAQSVQFANGVTLEPGKHEWREEVIPNIQKLYHGPEIFPVYYKDFIWPVNVANLHDADLLGRRFKRTISQLRDQYDPEGLDDELQEVLAELENVRDGTLTESTKDKPEHGEPIVSEVIEEPRVDVTEIYWDTVLEPDIDQNAAAADAGEPVQVARPVRLFMVIHEQTKACIWADYRANVCPRAQKPVFMPAINRVPGRAFGRGNYEMQEMASDTADRMLNGVIVRNEMVANPPVVWNSSEIEEGKTKKNIKWGPGLKIQTRGQSVDPKKVYHTIEIPDLDDRTWMIMQLHMQTQQAETGVTNAAQAAVSELPGNDLATGINALAEVASILHIYALEETKDGFQPGLKYAIELIYFNQDEDETYEYLEGNASAVLALSDAKQLAKLAMNVEITLTRAKRQEQREGGLAALGIIPGFEALMPDAKLRWKPAFEQALSGMGFQHPETYLPTDEELLAQIEAQQQQAAAMQEAELKAAATGQPAKKPAAA